MRASLDTPGCVGYRVRGLSGPLFFWALRFIASYPATADVHNLHRAIRPAVGCPTAHRGESV